MEVLSSSSGYPINSRVSLKNNQQQPVGHQQAVARLQIDKDVLSSDKLSTKQKTRLDIDQQVIQLVEQQTAKQSKQQTKNTDYDQPSEQNYTAIAAYQSVENQGRRDDIQQVFGVDLLA